MFFNNREHLPMFNLNIKLIFKSFYTTKIFKTSQVEILLSDAMNTKSPVGCETRNLAHWFSMDFVQNAVLFCVFLCCFNGTVIMTGLSAKAMHRTLCSSPKQERSFIYFKFYYQMAYPKNRQFEFYPSAVLSLWMPIDYCLIEDPKGE
jgi:hypothetical protein